MTTPGPISLSRGLSAAAAATATVVLLGWAVGSPAITTFGQRWTPMVANTSTCMLAAALAAAGMTRIRRQRTREWTTRALGGIVALLAVPVFVNFVNVWVRGTPLYSAGAPWRMAPPTAIALTVLAAALLLVEAGPRARRAAEALAGIALVIALVLLVSFLYGVSTLSDLMGRVNMSPITAMCLACVSLAFVLALPGGYLREIMWGMEGGSQLARRLVPLLLVAPAGIGWALLRASREGSLTIEYATAIIVLSTVVIGVGAVLASAGRVNRSEIERRASLEHAVAERTTELKVVNRELESFAYSVSHDLRTPLRALDGFSNALAEDYAHLLDATAKDYLARIRKGSQRMGELIDALLDLSRVARSDVNRVPVNLSTIAAEVVGTLRSREGAHAVTVQIAPELNATGDPRMLRALMQNLLGNAWKFTSRRPDARIEFACAPPNGKKTPVFVVRDNGAGFDMAYAAKLFGAFQRLHTDREFEGTGVGLATCQRIVHRHGGEIWAQAAPNEGAAFFFTLS